MAKGIRKAVVSNNPKIRMIMCTVDGTAGTPAATGLDASQIKEVIDNGAGDYTVMLKFPYNPASSELPHTQVSSLTLGVVARVTAVAHDRVTVEATADCDFNLMIAGNDNRLTY